MSTASHTLGRLSTGGWLATGPACVACTIPSVWPALASVGLMGVAGWTHNLGLLAVPFIVVILWRDSRRHGDRRPLRIGLAGGGLLATHAVFHLVTASTVAFNVTNWLGFGLLALGVVGNLLAVRGARIPAPEPLAAAPAA